MQAIGNFNMKMPSAWSDKPNEKVLNGNLERSIRGGNAVKLQEFCLN